MTYKLKFEGMFKKDENEELKAKEEEEEIKTKRGKTEKKTIFIGDLHNDQIGRYMVNDFNTTIKDGLLEHFSKFGDIEDIEVIWDKYSYYTQPLFLFITFKNKNDITRAFEVQIHTIIDAKYQENIVTVLKYVINHVKEENDDNNCGKYDASYGK